MSPKKKTILAAGIEKSRIPEIYRRLTPHYDFWGRLTESKARSRCLELAAIRDGESVLEVAVGTGLVFERLLKANPNGRNEGIDLTEAMLSKAKVRAEGTGVRNYRLSIGDAYHLEYPDETFDVLINNYMFDLLPEADFPALLSEFNRVLRHGGRMVVVSMTLGKPWFNALWKAVYRLNPAWLGGCRGVKLLPDLVGAGFEKTKREFISQKGFPSEVVFGIKSGKL